MLEKIKNIMIDREYILPDWKMRLVAIEGNIRSDYSYITVEFRKPKSKKVCVTWELYVNVVKEIIDFEKSNFYNKEEKS